VSVSLDTSGGRAYIHGMAITPNEGSRDMSQARKVARMLASRTDEQVLSDLTAAMVAFRDCPMDENTEHNLVISWIMDDLVRRYGVDTAYTIHDDVEAAVWAEEGVAA
jgi:hypothetical protein